MSVQRFDEAYVFSASTSLLSPHFSASSHAPALTQPPGASRGGIDDDAEWPAEAFVNLDDLGKGVRWALAIEVATALSLYSLWHLWRLWQ